MLYACVSLIKGQDIEAMVLSIDPERERISLGIKQLQADAFNDFVSSNPKGTKVNGTVKSVVEERITVSLSNEVEGFLSLKDFSNSLLDSSTLQEGLEVEVVIANINKKEREIILSIRALEKAEERNALEDIDQRNKEIEDATKSNLGDMIKAEIEDKESE